LFYWVPAFAGTTGQLVWYTAGVKKMSVLFIHRSVGQNLLDDGALAEVLDSAANQAGLTIEFADINNNLDHKIPANDTKPTDYLSYFSAQSCSEDLVIIKSCYPNNAIQSGRALSELKETYSKLVAAFLPRSKGKLLILTTPPLRPARTNPKQANRARAARNLAGKPALRQTNKCL